MARKTGCGCRDRGRGSSKIEERKGGGRARVWKRWRHLRNRGKYLQGNPKTRRHDRWMGLDAGMSTVHGPQRGWLSRCACTELTGGRRATRSAKGDVEVRGCKLAATSTKVSTTLEQSWGPLFAILGVATLATVKLRRHLGGASEWFRHSATPPTRTDRVR